MEFIGLVVVYLIVWAIWNLVVAGGKAAVKTATGPGTLAENMDLQLRGMGPLELRLVRGQAGEDSDGPVKYEIEVRGLIPVVVPTEVGFVTSVFDVTDGNPRPVASFFDMLQEPDSTAYQFAQSAGTARPDQGFLHWVNVATVIPAWLQPPRSGTRTLRIITRMVDWSRQPRISNGFCDPADQAAVLWVGGEEIQHHVTVTGWEERAEHQEEAHALSLRVGVAVAMADGQLHDEEGRVLQRWIERTLSFYDGKERERLRTLYNGALRGSYERALAGEQTLSDLVGRLNEVGEDPDKYDAVELCFDVMAADSIADEQELKLIKQVSDALGLDFDEVERMRDQRLVALDVTLSDQASTDEILGIDPAWDDETKRRFVREEFRKWNNRLNALAEGEERDNAQRMIDHLGEYRRRLDG